MVVSLRVKHFNFLNFLNYIYIIFPRLNIKMILVDSEEIKIPPNVFLLA